MATITLDFGKAGSAGGDASPNLATALRDVADDIAGLKPATVATTNAAVTAVADASGDTGSGALANDLKAKWNAAVTLINELKTRVNAPAGITVKTVKG